MAYLYNARTRVLARDLAYPEGPVYCRDGSVLLVEIKRQCLTRVRADGASSGW